MWLSVEIGIPRCALLRVGGRAASAPGRGRMGKGFGPAHHRCDELLGVDTQDFRQHAFRASRGIVRPSGTGRGGAPDRSGWVRNHTNGPPRPTRSSRAFSLRRLSLDDTQSRAAAHRPTSRFRGEWFVTGDEYLRDEDGFYHHCGRSDDMLKTSGLWVSPSEIEDLSLIHI